MTLHLSEALVDTLVRHAASAHPYECCGILIGRRSGTEAYVTRAVPADNIAPDDRHKAYQIDWKTLLATARSVRRAHEEIIGFYHSHPDGTDKPSQRDRDSAWVNHSYLILAMADGSCTRVTSWRTHAEDAALKQERINVR